MAAAWALSDDPYAAPMNHIPKIVFSKTLDGAEWADSRIARGDLATEIVDEYRLVLQPVALGHGLPLFKDLSTPLGLELVDAQTYGTGAALHVYRPASGPEECGAASALASAAALRAGPRSK
jgi:hypothetical protein